MITNPVVPTFTGPSTIAGLVSAIVLWGIVIAGILTLLYLVMGGIEWVLSGGDKAGLEHARERITNSIIGLGIAVSAWAIMSVVSTFLGLQFPCFPIPTLTGSANTCLTSSPGPNPSSPPAPQTGKPNGASCSSWNECQSKACHYGFCRACSDFNTDPAACSSHAYGCRYLPACYFNQGQICCVPK